MNRKLNKMDLDPDHIPVFTRIDLGIVLVPIVIVIAVGVVLWWLLT